jgi:hypothetical protein
MFIWRPLIFSFAAIDQNIRTGTQGHTTVALHLPSDSPHSATARLAATAHRRQAHSPLAVPPRLRSHSRTPRFSPPFVVHWARRFLLMVIGTGDALVHVTEHIDWCVAVSYTV